MSEHDVEPIKAGQIKAGYYIVKDNDVYLVKDIEKSKAGKHGHAKCRMKIENIFTGSKTEITVPSDTKLQTPIIDKRTAQVISIGSDSVQLMDMETYETFEASLPPEGELEGGPLTDGCEVEYWKTLGKMRIVRVK